MMEYCSLGAIFDLCIRQAMTEEAIASACRQVLEGLAYLHSDEVRVWHRDIKPDNLLINDKGVVKIGWCER